MGSNFSADLDALKKRVKDMEEVTRSIRICESQLMQIKDNLNNGSFAQIKNVIEGLAASVEKTAVSSTQLSDTLSQIIACLEKTEQNIMGQSVASGGTDSKNGGDGFYDKIQEMIDRILEMLKGKVPDNCEFGGDPINFTTGNFVYDRTYLMSKGLFPLKFQLNYNSLHTNAEVKKSVVGKAWTFQYGVHVVQIPDGMKVIWEDGHADYFKKADSVYLPEYDTTKKITMHDDTIEYENVQGKRYFFAKDTGLNTRISDANGNSLYLNYGESERLLSVANDSGERLDFEYNREGYICRVTDHANRSIQLLYDGEYLQSVIDELGNPFVFEYDENGFLSATVNARNIYSLKNKYDASGRVVKQVYPDDTSMLLEYNDREGTVKVTEQNKNVVTYRHDDRMRNVETIYEDGSICYKYNERNQKTSIVDKMGNEKKYEYDAVGNLTRIINPLNETLDIKYNSKRQVTAMIFCDKVIRENTYDSRGNLIEKKDAIGRVMKVENNVQGKPVCVVAPDGSKLLLTYDLRGNVTSITDALGGRTAYAYDSLNRVTSTTDAMGNRTEYEYDAKGHLIRVKKADGYDKTYTYNAGSLVTEIRDFNGAVTKKEYNGLNKLEKIILPNNGEIKYEYNELQQITKRIDPNGAVNCYEYNKLHHMVKATNAYGGTMQYEYDANGNRTKIISSDAGCVQYTYDALNRITSVKDADGSINHIEYNHFGQKTKMTDARGNVRQVIYNEAGQKEKVIDVLGNVTSFVYNEMGLLKEKIDPAGRRTRFEYLPGGFLNKIINPNQSEVTYKYNLNKKIISKTTSEGYELYFDYDCLNRIVKTTNNQGQENQYEYDTMGNCIRSVDGNGNVTAYEYDIMNNLIAVVDAEGNRTEYDYDCMGNVQDIYHCVPLQIQDIIAQNEENQRKLFMHYERDLYGQITEATDALGNTTAYDYDEHGRLICKTDADGMHTDYAYTLGGQLSQIQYEDGDSVYLSYNELKQLVEVKDWLGITTLELNDAGQPTKVTDSMGNEIAYERGVLGERKSLQYPDGRKVSYEYDDLLRLKAVDTGSGMVHYAYDSLGRITEKLYPNGTKSVIDYLQSGRVGNYAHYDSEGVLDYARYKYDAVGNTVGIDRFRRDMPEQSGTYQYEYDRMNRLVGVQKDQALLRQYSYDALGNRTSFVENGVRTDYCYDAANRLLQETAPDTVREYAYDKRGNMRSVLKNGVLERGYEYDAKNHIRAEINGTSAAALFEYDGFGHRMMEHSYMSDAISFEQGVVNFEGSLEPTNNITYILDHAKRCNNLLMEKDDDSTRRYLWDGGILGMEDDDKLFYCMRDLNGSPMRLMNEEAAVMENYGFDEFGREFAEPKEHMQPFGYAGFYRDRVTATYFVQLRNYEPATGRFSAQDVIKGHIAAPYMLNSYSYCFNRPIDLVDQSGAWPKWVETAVDWVCDGLDAIGDGIDYVVDTAGDFIQDGATYLFDGAEYLWENYVPAPVQDFASNAGSWLLERGRELTEIDFPFTNTDMSDMWCWFTTQTKIGRHFMGAGDFFATEDGVYHTNPDCWQQMMGYNKFYDYVFDGFTDMRVNHDLSFATADGTQYTIWMWKGDYYNLGAGCETGIYYGQPGDYHLNCATDTNLHMSIALYDGNGEQIFTYNPDEPQWWITGFDPSHQDADAGKLMVVGSIDFSDNPELWEAFLAKYDGKLNSGKYCIDRDNMTLNYRW